MGRRYSSVYESHQLFLNTYEKVRMRFNNLSFESFNLVGSVCSIIALLLTASSKLGISNLTQIVFGVLVGISVGGLFMTKVLSFFRYWLDDYSFFTKCLFWLVFGLIVALLALIFGRIGYWIMDMLINHVVLPVLDV